MKRIISLIIALVMLLSTLSTAISANDTGTDLPFEDVAQDAWYVEGIKYCFDRGIIKGMMPNRFLPFDYLTRAQFVQMLAALDGADLTEYADAESGFDDVSAKFWYNAAVCWAKEKGYVAGVSETQFSPNALITREQLARLLYVYGKSFEEIGFDMSASDDLSAFEDAESVSEWALDGVKWCVAAGIISGMTETTIAPRETATRAQACRMIMSFDKYLISGGPKDTEGAFKVMADYITSNGKNDEYFTTCYSYTETVNGVTYEAFYEPEMEFIVFSYGADQVEGYIGDAYYHKYATLSVDGLRTAYGYMFYDYSEEGKSVDQSGFMRSDGFAEYIFDYEGYEEADAIAEADEVREALMSFVEDFLAKCGVTAEEFYKIEITE